MKRQRRHRTADTSKRRTTLTLPADSLTRAGRIARARKVNLSTVISEALTNGLRIHSATERSEEILNAYKKAFGGFSKDEMLLLDGVVLDQPRKR
jgi:post-segregation antitoxin (ccd killing protein)